MDDRKDRLGREREKEGGDSVLSRGGLCDDASVTAYNVKIRITDVILRPEILDSQRRVSGSRAGKRDEGNSIPNVWVTGSGTALLLPMSLGSSLWFCLESTPCQGRSFWNRFED